MRRRLIGIAVTLPMLTLLLVLAPQLTRAQLPSPTPSPQRQLTPTPTTGNQPRKPGSPTTAPATSTPTATPSPAPVLKPGQATSLSGFLRIYWGDGPTSSTVIITLQPDADPSHPVELQLNRTTQLPRLGLHAIEAKHVVVTGVVASATSARHRFVITATSIQSSGTAMAPAVSPPSTMTWLNLLCRFADDKSEPNTSSFFDTYTANTYPGMGDYWASVSYGSLHMTAVSATAWMPMHGKSTDFAGGTDLDGLYEDCIASSTGVMLSNGQTYSGVSGYYGVNLFFNTNPGNGTTYGQVPGGGDPGRTWMFYPDYLRHERFAHEMGHVFHMYHSYIEKTIL